MHSALLLVLTLFWSGSAAGNVGKDWGIEKQSYLDPVSGIRIWEMTSGGSAADNLYFHFSNFTADNGYLIFTSDRTGSRQIFRAEMATGRIVQLTDAPGTNGPSACPDHTNARRIYYTRGKDVIALDILDFTERKVGSVPPPLAGAGGQPTLSGDGKWLTLSQQRDESTWEIGLMNAETGAYRTVITQGFRIGHVQHHPSDPLIFYVWETGGYAPQRTWLVNADGSGNRPYYARTEPKEWFTPLKEWVTHEAWVGGTGDMTMINDKQGLMMVDRKGSARMVKQGDYWHVAARHDGKYLVADDSAGRVWLVEAATGNERLLATDIRGKARVHAHPSFDRLGKYVQFHTAREHETVAVIDLDELPTQVYRR
jgi:oligogalacturonide lyase